MPKIDPWTVTINKGQDPEVEEYSPFNVNMMSTEALNERFKNLGKINGISDLYVVGLATDYCVKNTAIDLVKAGFKVTVILDLCLGVDPETTRSAIEEMKANGVNII